MANVHHGIPIVLKRPQGYVNVLKFAKRLGISAESVRKAKKTGKFEKSNLMYVPKKEGSRTYDLHISWEAEYPRYLKRWPKSKWPLWYSDPANNKLFQGTASQQQTLIRMADERAEQLNNADKQAKGIGTKKKPIADMGDAVLAEKILKVEKLQMEMDVEKNLLIEIDIVKQIMLESAQSVRQGFTSLIPRLVPLLSAETDLHKIRVILEQEFDTVLGQLAGMETFGDKK